MNSDFFRITLNLILAIAQFITANLVFGASDFEVLSADGPISAQQDFATPAIYAFAIWFLIYSLSVVYGVLQALPSQHSNPIYKKIGWYTAGCFASCVAWIVFARWGPAYLTIPLIVIMFTLISAALLISLQNSSPTKGERRVVRPLLGIYAGWLTAATVLNFTNILPEYGISIFGLQNVALAFFTLACASLIALTMIYKTKASMAYVLTLLWAQVAIIVDNLISTNQPLVAAGAGCVIVAIVITTFYVRKRSKSMTATR